MLSRPRSVPAGFIAPCLPTNAPHPPSGEMWLHEIKHDGFRVITRKDGKRVNEHIERDGPIVFAHACKMGLEGIVSKRRDWPYRSGRSPHWIKSKNPLCAAVKREAHPSSRSSSRISAPRHVIEAEGFEGHIWTRAVSSDGVAVMVSRLSQRALVTGQWIKAAA
jgi:hypothetical protein